MIAKVFISGSIEIQNLPQEVCIRLKNIMVKNMQVLVGDASGVDLLVQKFFADYDYNDVTVYSIYQNPRNFYSTKFKTKFVDVADDVKKERERQQFKDKQMSIDSNYSLIIWDSVSKGSFSNIIRALELGKKVVVYLIKEQAFLSKDKCTIPEIEFIYRKYNGYTASEILEYFQKERINTFSNIKQFHDFLIKNKIILKKGTKYEPNPELSQEKVTEFFIKTKYKGKDTGIKYTNNLIEWLEENIKKSNINEYSSEQGKLDFYF